MKLTFLGTRGYIEQRTESHGMHASTLVEYRGKGVLIDCGEDWLGRLAELAPKAIVVTHCHPDHAGGLAEGAPCPVYGSAETIEALEDFPLKDIRIMAPEETTEIRGMRFTYFPVEHSTRCPAGGFRISAGKVDIFYVPDVVYIRDKQKALSGCKAYIGDGATIKQSFVRKPQDSLIGHTPLRTQLTWCRDEGVPLAIFTHCGTEIVELGDTTAMQKIGPLAEERKVEARLAYDGLEMVLR